jgi:hypothetical protein
MTDVLGQTFFLTGQQAFIRVNVVRFQLGQSVLLTAPTEFNNGQPVAGITTTVLGTAAKIGKVSPDALSTTANLMAPAPDDGDVIMYLGPPVNPTVNFYKGSYQLAAIMTLADAAEAAAFSTVAASQTQADQLVVGQYRPIRLRVLYDDGRLSDPYEIVAEVIDDVV